MLSTPARIIFEAPTEDDIPQVLGKIAAVVQELAQAPEWPDTTEYKVNLILEELAVNTITYGRKPPAPEPSLRITITPTAAGAELSYQDTGEPFNPLTDAPLPLSPEDQPDEIPIGGQGLTLVKHMARSISYHRAPGLNSLAISVTH